MRGGHPLITLSKSLTSQPALGGSRKTTSAFSTRRPSVVSRGAFSADQLRQLFLGAAANVARVDDTVDDGVAIGVDDRGFDGFDTDDTTGSCLHGEEADGPHAAVQVQHSLGRRSGPRTPWPYHKAAPSAPDSPVKWTAARSQTAGRPPLPESSGFARYPSRTPLRRYCPAGCRSFLC